jgi:hypothetical protein
MYKIYFTNEYGEARSYNEDTLESALATVSGLRNQSRYSFVTMVSENPNSVGKPGVDSIEDGRLPSGEDYTWSKRR